MDEDLYQFIHRLKDRNHVTLSKAIYMAVNYACSHEAFIPLVTDEPLPFDAFLLIYPSSKHTHLKKARMAWSRLKPDQQLFDEIAMHLVDRRRTQYVMHFPNPYDFIYNCRWTDRMAEQIPIDLEPPHIIH